VLSEHWSGYLQESDIKFHQKNFIFKSWTKKIFANASSISVVSDYLGKSIQQLFPFVQYKVIPNVVNSELFFPAKKEASDKTIFIHASTMNFEKNVEGIIQAFRIVKNANSDFLLKLYGAQKQELIHVIHSLDLSDNIRMFGEVSQKELGSAMQQSDALIMNSRFETFGCVVIEANACGLPALVTNIPVWHELIRENVNGLFCKQNSPESLAEIILQFLANKNSFNQLKIASSASKYFYKNVGALFFDLYKSNTPGEW
jgi:glycosyltransferase involved in cell wall biosynthesis